VVEKAVGSGIAGEGKKDYLTPRSPDRKKAEIGRGLSSAGEGCDRSKGGGEVARG